MAANFVSLYRVSDSKNNVLLRSEDESLQKSKLWILQNLYPFLNSGKETTKSVNDYNVSLNIVRNKCFVDALLIVPLNQDTLGPDYQSKIDELRAIMLSKSVEAK